MNGQQMAADVLSAVKSLVNRATQPLADRLKALEERAPVPGPQGKDGPVGPQGERGAIGLAGPKGDIGEKGERGPEGIKGADGIAGRDGRDGKDGERGPMGERGPAGDQGPRGEKGADGIQGPMGERGQKGEPGIDGRNGKDADPEFIKSLVAELLPALVEKAQNVLIERLDVAVKAIRVPQDGKDGAAGRDGINGKDGADGTNGRDGKDFDIEQVRGLLESELSKWELDFERRAAATLQKSIDRMPIPRDGENGVNGKDGADGLGFDDLEFDYDGQRTFTIKAERGEAIKRKTFRMPIPIYRGTYKSADVYEKDDTVTYGGSLWIAQQDNPGTPGDGPTWKLAVRKGVDGKGSK